MVKVIFLQHAIGKEHSNIYVAVNPGPTGGVRAIQIGQHHLGAMEIFP
jgi:hypothetical protein